MPSGGKRSTAWKKGEAPIKQKGTKHRATRLKEAFGVKSWDQLKEFVEGKGIETLTTKMGRLKPRDYALVFLALTEFVKPKLQRTTIAGDGAAPLTLTVNHVQVAAPLSHSEEEVVV